MPLVKGTNKKEPLWKDYERKAKRDGLRAPIYEVNLDVYTGEWKNDKKHGENGLPFYSEVVLANLHEKKRDLHGQEKVVLCITFVLMHNRERYTGVEVQSII